jgi:hypothetical protein
MRLLNGNLKLVLEITVSFGHFPYGYGISQCLCDKILCIGRLIKYGI